VPNGVCQIEFRFAELEKVRLGQRLLSHPASLSSSSLRVDVSALEASLQPKLTVATHMATDE
jgi:hypothetical protein